MNVTRVRRATKLDISSVATIHKQQFRDHFLGKYSELVIEKYYLSYLEKCIFLVSERENKINGFALGGWKNDIQTAKSEFLRENALLYIMDTAIRPWVYWDAISKAKTLLKPTRIQPSNEETPSMRLLSIAVIKDVMGSGIAGQLLVEFEEAITPWSTYGLSALEYNKRAIAFYIKNGFDLEKIELGAIYLRKTNFN
jgi:ribosomal protein S18 acetylase RimI-like enzyme